MQPNVYRPVQTPGVIWCVTQDRPADRYCVNQGHTHRTGVQLEVAETESTELEQLKDKIRELIEQTQALPKGLLIKDEVVTKLKELTE